MASGGETASATVSGQRRRRRRWTFGTVVLDEASWSLTVDGRAVAIEAKPLELLHELCLRAGETVSKDELLETVWGGLNVVENSIPTAVAKLRRALGPTNQDAIATVTRIGYRLAAPVAVESYGGTTPPRFAFSAGDVVPGRPQWRLLDALGDGPDNDVWRARHEKTGELRVFKFADAPDRLRALKCEATVSRLLLSALGPDGPFVPLLEWNFETAPYFLESRFCGLSLLDWAAAAGGLAAIPLERRIAIAARCAHALAAVHEVGVLHRDLKPANILVDENGGGLQIRLADFGSGRVTDIAALSAFAITAHWDEAGDAESLSGTPFYRAPELTAGAVPTIKSDIYSLGLVLFQLVVGDFGRVPAPLWEREVDDPLLRADIAAAAAGDPSDRIDSAAILAERLDSIAQRRQEAAVRAADAARLEEMSRLEARWQARRPWIAAAAAAGIAGLLGTSAAAVIAFGQRDEARRQQEIAQASYAFLADDLLARADPAKASSADETITEASKRASAEIDTRFAKAPMVAGQLHHSLARAFDQRTDLASARQEYAKAEAAFARAGTAGAENRAIVQLHWAQMDALSGDPALLPDARRRLELAKAASNVTEGATAVWLASTEGAIALASEDVPAAQKAFARAVALADALPPGDFDARQKLNLRQRVAFTYLRLGDGAKAEEGLKPLAAAFEKLEGADHPDTLNIRLNLIQALLVQKRHDEVIRAADALLPMMERRFGRDHRRTMQLLAVRMQSLGSVERYAEAAADGERVWRVTAAHEGPNTFQAVAGRADTATSQCRAGRFQDGIANARAAVAAARGAPGPETALSMALRATLADCLIQSGRPAEAAPLLADIDRRKVSELVGDADWAANLDLALARVALAAGDRGEARKRIEAARPVMAGKSADRFQAREFARVDHELSSNKAASDE